MPFDSDFMTAAILGLGATLILDLWAIVQQRVLGIPSLDYRLVGRWLLLLPTGRIIHSPITATSPVLGEVSIGWTAHYLIGAALGVGFIALVGADWYASPSPLPAIAFGMLSVAAPYFVLQPCLGAGIAASKTPAPNKARLLSLTAHTIFGLGLYLSAVILQMLTQ